MEIGQEPPSLHVERKALNSAAWPLSFLPETLRQPFLVQSWISSQEAMTAVRPPPKHLNALRRECFVAAGLIRNIRDAAVLVPQSDKDGIVRSLSAVWLAERIRQILEPTDSRSERYKYQSRGRPRQ